jgi:hypothetical protein
MSRLMTPDTLLRWRNGPTSLAGLCGQDRTGGSPRPLQISGVP